MKKLTCFLLLCALLFSLSACGKDGTDVQVIYPIDTEPEYLDPQIASGSESACIIAACFEGLMTFDESGALVPAAAESFEVSPGGLNYTFHLRDDLRWRVTNTAAAILGEEKDSFDKRITAEDFVFGLRRALRPETNSPAAPYLMAIKNAPDVFAGSKAESKLGVKAVDDLTLEIKLTRKDDGFLFALTLPGAMPCDQTYFEATHGRYGLSPEYFICNGPFYISNWNSGTAITVRKTRKNMDPYRDPNDVKPASIYFSINSEQATRDAKVKSGTYEAARLTAAQADVLSGEKHISVRSFQNAVFGLLFNCSDPVLKSSAIRRAIAMTFNTAPMLEALALPQAAGLVPPACLWGDKPFREQFASAAWKTGSTKEAKTLLQSGMDALDLRDVELTVLCSTAVETAVRTVMQQWQSAFGVHFSIAVEALEEAEVESRVRSGEYQMAFSTLTFSNTSALDTLLRFCSGRNGNVVRLNNEKYDALLQSVSTAVYPKEVNQAVRRAEQVLVEQAVILPVAFTQTYLGFAKGVSGIGTNPTGDVLYFKHAIKV